MTEKPVHGSALDKYFCHVLILFQIKILISKTKARWYFTWSETIPRKCDMQRTLSTGDQYFKSFHYLKLTQVVLEGNHFFDNINTGPQVIHWRMCSCNPLHSDCVLWFSIHPYCPLLCSPLFLILDMPLQTLT